MKRERDTARRTWIWPLLLFGAALRKRDASRPQTTDALYHRAESHPHLAPAYQVGKWRLYAIEP